MTNSTVAALPQKPHPDFPLTPRSDGRWCKRINGRLRYISGAADEALTEWLRVKDDWLAGREAPPKDDQAVTLDDVINSFRGYKEQLRDTGELAPRTFERYEATGNMRGWN